MPIRRILHYWGPAALCAAAILAASSEPLAASHTGEWIQTIITRLAGSPLAPERFAIAHFIVRKLGHLTAYGIFGFLVFRGWRGERTGWSWRWAAAAVVCAAVLAAADEWHQTFVPGRTGVASDVFLDVCGATLAQFVILKRCGSMPS
jgi:VanZ family protein